MLFEFKLFMYNSFDFIFIIKNIWEAKFSFIEIVREAKREAVVIMVE